ncbi:MAG: hypothetical protein KGJ37_06420 [Verrucomicrobiota bacterium]|nr:hypothetical protein [Verrucomicrobiota bacterium]
MKIHNLIILSLAVLACAAFSGCGKKEAKQRLQQEQQGDAAKANKAITNLNQSMFSKMNASTPGAAPATSQPPPSSAAPSTTNSTAQPAANSPKP